MRATTFGRYILAVGGNEAAARLAGVPVAASSWRSTASAGCWPGIAGLIAIAINSSSDANNVGQDMELDAIAAVAVGRHAAYRGPRHRRRHADRRADHPADPLHAAGARRA